jgi:steroid delta-isomerase-like uncharacterized protein
VDIDVRQDAEALQRRIRLVDEHVQAEVDHDVEAIMRTWGKSPWFDDVPWDEQSYGRDQIETHYRELLHAFPDLGIDVKERRVTDDAVILEVVVSGTHKGDWRGLPALGRRMESRVCAIYTFDEDELLELERTYYDKAKILEQLGIFKDPRTPLGKVAAVLTPPFEIVRALVRRVFRH